MFLCFSSALLPGRAGAPLGAPSQGRSRALLVMQTHMQLPWELTDMGHQAGFSSVLLALSAPVCLKLHWCN